MLNHEPVVYTSQLADGGLQISLGLDFVRIPASRVSPRSVRRARRILIRRHRKIRRALKKIHSRFPGFLFRFGRQDDESAVRLIARHPRGNYSFVDEEIFDAPQWRVSGVVRRVHRAARKIIRRWRARLLLGVDESPCDNLHRAVIIDSSRDGTLIARYGHRPVSSGPNLVDVLRGVARWGDRHGYRIGERIKVYRAVHDVVARQQRLGSEHDARDTDPGTLFGLVD